MNSEDTARWAADRIRELESRLAIDDLNPNRSERIAELEENLDWAKVELDWYKERNLELETKINELGQWKRAIDDALVVTHLGTAESFGTAERALNKLLVYEQQLGEYFANKATQEKIRKLEAEVAHAKSLASSISNIDINDFIKELKSNPTGDRMNTEWRHWGSELTDDQIQTFVCIDLSGWGWVILCDTETGEPVNWFDFKKAVIE